MSYLENKLHVYHNGTSLWFIKCLTKFNYQKNLKTTKVFKYYLYALNGGNINNNKNINIAGQYISLKDNKSQIFQLKVTGVEDICVLFNSKILIQRNMRISHLIKIPTVNMLIRKINFRNLN